MLLERVQVVKIKTWSDDSMKAPLKAITDSQSVSQAATDCRIPNSSLFDHVSSKVLHGLKPWIKAYLSSKQVTLDIL